jgi:tol-pal system beta propeller repeat protein TolB
VLEEDGKAAKPLTNNCVSEFDPAWSPDGLRIAYSRETQRGARDIYAINADGTQTRKLTNSKLAESKPAWSPDGEELAFARSFSRDSEIFRMSRTGERQMQITSTPGSNWDPAWSSRNEIAFTSTRDTRRQIYVMASDGSRQRRLTDFTFHAYDPAWSPDGTKVVFVGSTGLTADLWVIPATGGEMKRLTNLGNYVPASDPAWSPDGEWIIFSADSDSGKDSRHALALVPAAGGSVSWLRYEPVENLMPDWQPVSDRRLRIEKKGQCVLRAASRRRATVADCSWAPIGRAQRREFFYEENVCVAVGWWQGAAVSSGRKIRSVRPRWRTVKIA